MLSSLESKAQFILNGNASTTSSECSAAVTTYLLTPQQNNQSGQIWYTNKVNLTQSFDIQFQMFLGTKCYTCGGADGICFVFQQQSTSAGSAGGGLGYAGITPSIAAEFDTYQNGWDPAYCHTAIEKNGDVDHTDGSGNNLAGPVQLDPTNPNIPDGNWHNMEVTWNPTSMTMSVYFDCNLRLTYTGDIINSIFGGNPNVYWGFTAGTGGGDNTQEVCVTHSYLNNLRDTAVCNGSPVPLNASGGNGATYSWAPAAGLSATNTANVTATPATTTIYTVSITNSCGLTVKDSVEIRVSNTTLTPTSTIATCGNNNGTASVTAAGGIAPYTFSWNDGQTSTTATGLGPGSYTVTSTDSLGCKATGTIAVTGTPQLRDSIASFTNVSVACGSNGTATVGIKGGTAPYVITWSNGQNTTTATNLGAGSYTVTVTDANGCSANAIATITQPGALTASITGTTPVLCNGGATGTATGSVTGGNAPYTYLWSNGQTNLTATALTAGSYTLSITDANGCTVTAIATVTQPAAIRDSIAATVNVLCNGGNNGTATDGVKDGTSPYTYAWSNGQNAVTATALVAGSYTVVVTDANGCKDSTIATITQPSVLTITAAAFPATCNGTCTGSATVIPAGGAGGYTYLWSNANTSANDNGLCAGNYSVVVTDANGCVHDSNPLTVTQPPPIVLTKTSTTAFCGQADGSASVTVTGGTPPYAYLWSNGNSTTAINNVTPGAYCFGVEDANKCVDSICVIVPNQTAETASITSTTPVSCNGGNNGSAIGSAVGGVLPYTYLWSNGQTSSTATGLIAGSYTFTVTDANGCQSTAIATITQPSVVTVSIAAPPTICIGQTTILTSTGNGGTPAYTYLWNTGSTSDTAAVHPVVTSTYTVTVTDANGCISTPVTVTVTVNPPLSVTVGKPVAMCPGATAKVTATAAGGDGTYNYSWAPGGSTSQTTTVSPATTMYYTVTVTDGCGTPPVKDSMQVIVDPLPVVNFKADTTNGCYPVCVNFTDLTTIATGGLKSWQWAFGDGGASALQNPMNCYGNPGLYNVSLTVTSDSGCAASFTFSNMITVYSHPSTSFSASPQPTNISQPDITFTDLTSDAYGITQWFWNFGDTISGGSDFSASQNPVHDYSDTGTYCIKLIDMNKFGCVDSSTQCIVIDPLFTLYIPNAFTPNHDGMNDVFIPKGGYFTYFEMYVFDRWGTSIYHTTDITKGWNGSVNNGATKCQQDTYVYLIHVIDWRGADHFYNGRVTLME